MYFRRPLPGLLLLCLPFFSNGAALQQDPGRAERVARVRATVAQIGTGPRARARVELRSRLKVKGLIHETGPDDFIVVSTEDKTIGLGVRARYADVVRLGGRGVSLYFPGLPQDGIGAWQDVRALEPGESVTVILINGKEVKGVLRSSTEEAITVADSGRPVEYRREEVSRLILRAGGNNTLLRSVVDGTRGGVEVARDVGRASTICGTR